jgi:hypothetical protein
LEITIVMAMGVAAIGAYRGWFQPSGSSSPMPPAQRVKAQLGRRLESQTGLSPRRFLAERSLVATSPKGMPCC